MYCFCTELEIAMVSDKELRRKTLSDYHVQNDIPEHTHSVFPRRTRRVRISRSVDRESRTDTGVDYSSTKLRSEYANPALTRPSLQRRRFSLSAIRPTVGSAVGIEDDTSITDAENELYGIGSKSASNVRWSRKGVVYTAENMGFAREVTPRRTGRTTSILGGSGYVPKTNVDSRSRTGSVTRFADDYSYTNDHTEDRRRRFRLRASSVPRMDDGAVRSRHVVSNEPIVRRRAASVARTYRTGVDRGRPSYASERHGTASIHTADSDGFDIASFVLAPGEQFIPTNVDVSVLPSGRKAVTYTRFSQKGTGDQLKANVELDRIIQRTNRLQVAFQISVIVLIFRLSKLNIRNKASK